MKFATHPLKLFNNELASTEYIIWGFKGGYMWMVKYTKRTIFGHLKFISSINNHKVFIYNSLCRILVTTMQCGPSHKGNGNCASKGR